MATKPQANGPIQGANNTRVPVTRISVPQQGAQPKVTVIPPRATQTNPKGERSLMISSSVLSRSLISVFMLV